MILIKVCELIVKKNGGLKICKNIEFDDTLFLVRDIGDRRVVTVIQESITRRGRIGTLFVFCTQPIQILVGRNVEEVKGVIRRRRTKVFAVGIIEGHVGNKGRPPDKQAANWRKDDSDNKQSGKNGLWSQDGLPCLEPLLLECSVYVWCQIIKSRMHATDDVLAGRFQPPFSFLFSDSDDSEPLFFFLLKSPMMGGTKEELSQITTILT